MPTLTIPTPMSPTSLRRWGWIHKWSSLVCTVFMLLLCLTGLPLIYHHEIGHLLGTDVEAPSMPADTPRAVSYTHLTLPTICSV